MSPTSLSSSGSHQQSDGIAKRLREVDARPNGSRFEPHLAWMKEHKVDAYNWGFVAGKSQTIYPWDSWQKQYSAEPPEWFHDIFRADGSPFREEEVAAIRKITGGAKPRQ